MKTLKQILPFVWLILCLGIGIRIFMDTPGQIEKEKSVIENELKPSVDFISNFKNTNKRLPTSDEFYTWENGYYNDSSTEASDVTKISYITSKEDVIIDDQRKFENADWTKDYAIGIWRGDWNDYYFSWTNSYETNGYTWFDRIIGFIAIFAIGLVPLLFWWIKIRKVDKKK